jgi:CheY-like chemotaxis protein
MISAVALPRRRKNRLVPEKRELMLVDDDATDIAMFERAVAHSGFNIELEVVEAADKALHRLHEQASFGRLPDALLLDIRLPGMNGHEALRLIRADPELCELPVFMITGSTSRNDRSQAYEYFVAGYIEKDCMEYALLSLRRVISHLDRIRDLGLHKG